MVLAPLLSALAQRGATLTARDGRLGVTPAGSVSDLREAISTYKNDLLRLVEGAGGSLAPGGLLAVAFAQALEGRPWLILEVVEPDRCESRLLTRETVERLALWAAGRRWRVLDPDTPGDDPPRLLLEG
ncbi:MAG: hypothetical protein HZB27_01185 [Meiothermus silvanus]|nr:hypothetical protein [Allomeiothermus silvanus]